MVDHLAARRVLEDVVHLQDAATSEIETGTENSEIEVMDHRHFDEKAIASGHDVTETWTVINGLVLDAHVPALHL